MEKKKMALLFTGLHYFKDYKHWKKEGNGTIDFRKYVENIKTKIINFFLTIYTVDIYICTNSSDLIPELKNIYNPVHLVIEESKTRILKTKALLDIIPYSEYDMFCETRLDIYILDKMNNINYDKFNIVSTLLNEKTDDNLFIFPTKYFKKYKTAINGLDPYFKRAVHNIDFPSHNIDTNVIKDEKTNVSGLSFFALRYFNNDKEFIINRYMFTDKYKYIYKDSCLYKRDNNILLTSRRKLEGGYLMYDLEEEGIYNIRFEIKINKSVSENFSFVKLLTSKIKYKTQPLLQNKLINIDLMIETEIANDVLMFDFRSSSQSGISVLFKKIEIKKQHKNKKCLTQNCLYIRHPKLKNNGGYHCCMKCKNNTEEVINHGKHCTLQECLNTNLIPSSTGVI